MKTKPNGIQIVKRNKPTKKTYIRETPYTVFQPTHAQSELRLNFGDAAKLAKGRRGLAPNGLPWAAYFTNILQSGIRSEYAKEKLPKWKARLRRELPDEAEKIISRVEIILS